MRIISRKGLTEFWTRHPPAQSALRTWFSVARRANWRSLDQTRDDFPHADQVRVASGAVVTVFNIAGNRYRLVTAIHYNTGKVFLLRFLTHAEYSKGSSTLGGPGRWRDLL